MARTYPIQLDRTRQIEFTANQIRLLDRELGRIYGKGFTYFLQAMAPDLVDRGGVDLRYDVLVTAVKYGLGKRSPGLADEQVAEMIHESPLPEIEVWGVVVEAYTDARGMDLQVEEEDEEPAGNPPETEAAAV